MPRYWLAKDVYWCLNNGHLIFLDLRRDKYMCLNRENSQALASLLHGLGTEEDWIETATLEGRIGAAINTLIKNNILTHTRNIRGWATPHYLDEPTEKILPDEDTEQFSPTWMQKAAFYTAAIAAHTRLRLRDIERIVHSVRQRKDHRRIESFDECRAKDIVRVFHVMRPFFPRENLCLFDSLALVELLAKYDLFPAWVFGVKADPFGAHCWVQHGNMLLNDSPEYVRTFTPIMTA